MRQGFAVVLLGLVLAGCGGDDEDAEPPEATGVLHSKVQGVGFRTPTRSGKTDANGSFRYLPGETVTFSVGGIELGAAPGAATISLFTLAGLTPPTTELALRRELNRLRYTSTPLAEAVNRAWLLLALDADGNPANGIDVTAHESALAGANLGFGLRIFEYPAKASRLSPGMNNNIPYSFPIKWLYRSLGMTISANVPEWQLNDLDGDGVVDVRVTVERDSAGEIIANIAYLTDNASPEQSIRYERDTMERLVRVRDLRDFNDDGEFDSDSTSVATYDAHGNRTRLVEWQDAGSDGGIDSESIDESTFDPYGRVLESVRTIDSNYDGTLDSREVRRSTYDSRGNLLHQLVEIDLEADGAVNGRYVTEYTWDAADREVSSRNDRDFDADGHIDVSWRTASTYGATENRTSYTEEQDNDGDGIYEQQYRASFTHDSAGNMVRHEGDYEAQSGGGGYLFRSVVEATYDADRRPLSRTLSYDFDDDGTIDTRDAETNTYDANGLPLSWEYVADFFADDDLIIVDRTQYSYTPEGALVLQTQSTDFDGDGVPESQLTVEVQYGASANAIAPIVTQYLGF